MDRREYGASWLVIGKNVLYGVGGGFLAALVASWFVSFLLAVALGLVAGAAIIYFAVFADNITVVVDDETISVLRFGQSLHSFPREGHSFQARVVTTTGDGLPDSECWLTVVDPGGNETRIDCGMLGRGRFLALLDDLGLNDPEPIAVPTSQSRD